MQGHEILRETGHAERTRRRPKARAEQRRPAIVLVEDDDALRLVSSEVLRAAGFDVLECPTLLAAFVAMKHRVPDILLQDRELPDGSGLDLARWVRRRSSFAGVRVIGFSARKSARDVEAALAAGCDAFVGKPCAPAKLVAVVHSNSPRP
jgi:DNA-binding response OmpR family regulator